MHKINLLAYSNNNTEETKTKNSLKKPHVNKKFRSPTEIFRTSISCSEKQRYEQNSAALSNFGDWLISDNSISLTLKANLIVHPDAEKA